MDAEFIRQALKAGGQVTTRHENGVVYYLDHIGQMQFDGEWFECVMYHSIHPFGQYCRQITDFEKFHYCYNETFGGPRG